MSRTTLAGLLTWLFAVQPMPCNADEESELKAVQERVRSLQQRLSKQSAARDAETKALKSVETEIGQASRQLAELAGQRQRLAEKERQLSVQLQASAARLKIQQQALAQQLRMSYMTGRRENLRLLLNQDSPERLGRMMAYYDYLNRARRRRIEAVQSELANLTSLREENTALLADVATLEKRQAGTLKELEAARTERQAVVARLAAELREGGSQLRTLQEEERHLQGLVEELRALLKEFPADSEERFSELRGQLAWPVKGNLVKDFGQPRAGSLTWNGVLLGARHGDPVRALYHGRIVFADWLAGMGLLVVIDHGQGYMSLYGHNDALLREAGDWVEPGERIALVGDSGGQPEPALYFEIRRSGVPENPRGWIKRRGVSR